MSIILSSGHGMSTSASLYEWTWYHKEHLIIKWLSYIAVSLSMHLDTAYFAENWKQWKNNNKLLFMLESTVHMPDCTVHAIGAG